MTGNISFAMVEATRERIASTPQEQGDALLQEMAGEQPVLLAYLLAASKEVFTEDELGLILFTGYVVWQIMLQSDRKLGPVTRESLEVSGDENIRFLQDLSAAGQTDFAAAAEGIIEAYPEPEVLRYLVGVVVETDAGGQEPGFRDEVKPFAYFHLKTALDAMVSKG